MPQTAARRNVSVRLTTLALAVAALGGAIRSAGAQTTAAGWTVTDVGNPPAPGNVVFGSTITMSSRGYDVNGTADQFTFAYRGITGDTAVIARVRSLQGGDPLAMAGVMIRESLSPGAAHASLFVTPSGAVVMRSRRPGTATTSERTSGTGTAALPVWLKIERRGTGVVASRSTDGMTWSLVGEETNFTLAANVVAGVAGTSHSATANATSALPDVMVIGHGVHEGGWIGANVGGPVLYGGSWTNGRSVIVDGVGRGLAGTGDQIRFVYRPVSGNSDVVVRVGGFVLGGPEAQAGIVLRQDLTSGSASASITVSPTGALRFATRGARGQLLQTTNGGSMAGPVWLKLSRQGSNVSAAWSADGTNWTPISGTRKVSWTDPLYVGIGATGGSDTSRARTTFNNVWVGTNPPPVVTLTSPAAETTTTAPGSLTLMATAVDANGVAGVDFYAGTTLLGSDTTSPYAWAWNNVAAGNYAVRAVARDKRGASGESATVTVVVNAVPSVSLTAPISGASVPGPAVTITAGASDPDGSIAKVDFYDGATLLGSTSTSPYAFSWANASSGTHVLKAVATDNRGATTTSATRTITVVSNTAPTVTLTSPTGGASFTAPASISLTATASDTDGTIAAVDFYAGTVLLASDTTSPYGFTWSNVQNGTHVLKAVARDNGGATTTSATVSVTVASNAAPNVSLTTPTNGASFTAPASISLTATASDTDGTVSRVDFYNGTTLLGSDTTSPYAFTWASVPAGSYSITAVARDNAGGTTVSSTRDISVTVPGAPSRAVFSPASIHETVDRYVLEIFAAGSNVSTATPVATQDLGIPAIVNNECSADVRNTIANLPAGSYVAVVSAVSTTDGTFRSTPSPAFTK